MSEPDDDPIATAQAEIHSEFSITLTALVEHWCRLEELRAAYARLVRYTQASRDAIRTACCELTGDPDFDPSNYELEVRAGLKLPR